MRPSRKFTTRILVYPAVLLYLAGDLFWFHGLLYRRVAALKPDSEESMAAAARHGIVAKVFGKPIYASQVERAALERLRLEALSLADLDPTKRREARMAALNDLVDHELLRTKVDANAREHPVADEVIDATVARFKNRFENDESMHEVLAAEGIDSDQELRFRLAARLQQEAYVRRLAMGDGPITEDEAREWFGPRAAQFEQPAEIRLRHMLVTTHERDTDEARTLAERALDSLKAGKPFDEIVGISEDSRSKVAAGDLGWVTRDRLPEDFAAAVFELPEGTPELIRTKLGWHVVEITGRRGPVRPTFDEVRDDVMAALESARLDERVREVRRAIRATERIGIHFYYENLGE